MSRSRVRLPLALSISLVLAGVHVAGYPASTVAPSVFSTDEVLDLRLQAPFNHLFASADDDAKQSVEGVVSYNEPGTRRAVVLDHVEISVRGHSSRRETECSFPKLRLRFADGPDTAASIFRDDTVVKVGTHCGEMPDGELMPAFGRWANQKAAHREALVYRLLDAAGVRTLRVRAARISYVYTDPRAGEGPDQAKPVVRDAFLLEDERSAMRRRNATGRLEPPGTAGADTSQRSTTGLFTNAASQFRPEDSAQLAFAEAMVGNFDWAIKFSADDDYRNAAKGLWNVLAFVVRDRAFPVPYDFDLSGMVTGSHTWFGSVFERDFLPDGSPADVEVFAQVQRTRSLFPRSLLDATRARFLAAKQKVYDVARTAPVDEDGRAFALKYLDAFFSSIERDDAFYVPVVARPGVVPYADAEGRRAACGDTKVPPGTPVSPRDRQADNSRTPVPLIPGGGPAPLVPARLLDVEWRFAASSSSPCDAVRRGVVWVDSSAIASDYPIDRR